MSEPLGLLKLLPAYPFVVDVYLPLSDPLHGYDVVPDALLFRHVLVPTGKGEGVHLSGFFFKLRLGFELAFGRFVDLLQEGVGLVELCSKLVTVFGQVLEGQWELSLVHFLIIKQGSDILSCEWCRIRLDSFKMQKQQFEYIDDVGVICTFHVI